MSKFMVNDTVRRRGENTEGKVVGVVTRILTDPEGTSREEHRYTVQYDDGSMRVFGQTALIKSDEPTRFSNSK